MGPRGLTKIKLASLNDECYFRIKDAILTGDFSWGDRLDVGKLAENFGISKFPVIKALDRLAIEHLITILPNKGTFVISPTRKDVEEVTEIRIMLEDLAFTLACEKDLSRLVTMLEKNEKENNKYFKNFCEGKNVGEYLKYDRDFHSCFTVCSENQRVISYYEVIRSQVELFFNRTFNPQNVQLTLDYHRTVLNHLKQNKVESAREQLKKHLSQVHVLTLNSLEES